VDYKTDTCLGCGMFVHVKYMAENGLCFSCDTCEKSKNNHKAECFKTRHSNEQPKKYAYKDRKAKRKAQRKARRK